MRCVVADKLDPDFYLIQLLPYESKDDWLAETIDVPEDEWEQWCLDNGAATLMDRDGTPI